MARRSARLALVAALVAWLAAVASPASASNDYFFPAQWGLGRIGAPSGWAVSTGSGVVIGIVDTGVDLNHEDLQGKVMASTSCVGSAGDPLRCQGSAQDDNGHGTHVSGIAAASKDNGRGIAGVAPAASLVVAKALAGDGSGSTDDINAGIRWVVDHGARVVNLSVADPVFAETVVLGSPLREGIDYAYGKGAIVVIAAGNSGSLGSQGYNDLNAIVVGATGPDDAIASYSAPTGPAKWALVAPGGAASRGHPENDVISTFWVTGKASQYAYLAGTSMAAPHVAGAAALLLAHGMGRDAAIQKLLATANPAVACGGHCTGRLDVAKALDVAPAVGTATTPTTAPTAGRSTTTTSRSTTPTSAPAPVVVTGGTTAPAAQPAGTTSTTAPPTPASAPVPAPVDTTPTTQGGQPAPPGAALAMGRPGLRRSSARDVTAPGAVAGLALAAVAAALAVAGRRSLRGGAAR